MATPADFDPLAEWLGIPVSERPPTHYALLGLRPGETSDDVIQAAYLSRYQRVRRYEVGPRQEDAVQILEDLSRAFLVLSNPDRKQDYDQTLQAAGRIRPAGSAVDDGSTEPPVDGILETGVETSCPNPKCGAPFLLQPEWAGAQGNCKTCGAQFVIGDDLRPLLLSSTQTASDSNAAIVETPCPNPKCQAMFVLRREWAGARANCKTCGVEFLIAANFALELQPGPQSVARGEPTWEQFDEIQLLDELSKLQEDLRQFVLDGQTQDVPQSPFLQETRRQHDRLAGEIIDLQEQAEQLKIERESFIERLGRLARYSDAQAHHRRQLDEIQERLGQTVYQAFVAEALPDHPLLAERKTCGYRLARLQEDQKRLASSGWFSQRAKGQALRAINRGELQRERSVARSLEIQIGRELMESNSLDSVQCAHTAQTIAEVRQIQTDLALSSQAVAQLRAELEANNQVIPPSLELAKVLAVNRFEAELADCAARIQAKRLQLTALRSSFPDQMLESVPAADLAASSELSRLVRSLQAIQRTLSDKARPNRAVRGDKTRHSAV